MAVLMSTASSCELKKKLVSLSGPMTMLLEEFDLLSDKKLVGISKFHPVASPTRAIKLAGGMFLSKKNLKKFKDMVIFFDKSRELSNVLKMARIEQRVEIDTRGLDPFQTVSENLEKLKNIVINCQDQINRINIQIANIQNELQLPKLLHHSIFYLGIINEKMPNLIIGMDGFVLSLMTLSYFKTYPTDLAYVPWSNKILSNLKDYTHIGLMDSGESKLSFTKKDDRHYNFSFRGLLIPGIRQVHFLNAISKINFQNKDLL